MAKHRIVAGVFQRGFFMSAIKKATRIELFNMKSPATRAFHITWFSFFLCFFGWFGIAPLMAIVREEFSLSKTQIGNTIIASVLVTVFARLLIGWIADKVGPRRTYTWLLILGSLPVMLIGFAGSYGTFLMFRLLIGIIGASFVITQLHTSLMYGPNCVGTANATSAGWGNLGGGVTQMVMPLFLTGFIALGFSEFWAWRLSMVIPGILMFGTGFLYYFGTRDTMEGDFEELRKAGRMESSKSANGAFLEAVKDKRVWALFVIYGACFGIELTINNVASLYFMDNFGVGLKTAGIIAGLFGLMNIFARTLGGYFGDKFGMRWGLRGRVKFLQMVLFLEGISLIAFSQISVLWLAIPSLVIFSLFVQMSEGATFSTVPFVNKRALGAVSGIVGAGGNVGAVLAGFLFRAEGLSWTTAMLILGTIVLFSSGLAVLVKFSKEAEVAAQRELEERLQMAHAA